MVRSLAVIGAMVAALYLLVPRPGVVEQPPVDVRAAVAAANAGMGTSGRPALLTVPDVPPEWRANAASWRPVGPAQSPTLHVGYLTTSKQFAEIQITNQGTPAWLKTVTQDGAESGTATVADRLWHTYLSADGKRQSLVLVRPAAELYASVDAPGATVTTVVTGTASRAELTTLAEDAIR